MNIDAKEFLYQRGLITRSTDDAKDWRVDTNADNVIQAMEDYAAFIAAKPIVKESLLASTAKRISKIGEKDEMKTFSSNCMCNYEQAKTCDKGCTFGA